MIGFRRKRSVLAFSPRLSTSVHNVVYFESLSNKNKDSDSNKLSHQKKD